MWWLTKNKDTRRLKLIKAAVASKLYVDCQRQFKTEPPLTVLVYLIGVITAFIPAAFFLLIDDCFPLFAPYGHGMAIDRVMPQ